MEKLEEIIIETPEPEHDHFLKSTSVGVLELSEMEESEVVKFIKKDEVNLLITFLHNTSNLGKML